MTSSLWNKWDITGLVAVVTGAGGAIGRELAIILRRDFSCHLALVDSNEDRLKETLACVSFVDPHNSLLNLRIARTTTHIVDVANRQMVMEFAEDVRASHGHCELVFNNAGIASAFAFDQVPLEEVDRVMSINLGGVLNIAKAFLPLLKASERSALVNTSSILGLTSFPASSAYCMSKYGITAFGQCLALEAAEFFPHVAICNVHPGFVRTGLIMNSKESILPIAGRRAINIADVDRVFKHMGSTDPKDAAFEMIEGVRRGKHRILIGSDARIFDMVVRIFPSIVYSRILYHVFIFAVLLGTRFIGKRVLVVMVVLLGYLRPNWIRNALTRLVKQVNG